MDDYLKEKAEIRLGLWHGTKYFSVVSKVKTQNEYLSVERKVASLPGHSFYSEISFKIFIEIHSKVFKNQSSKGDDI